MSSPQDRPQETPENTLTLSLIAHTNVGKTTLARTLLQRDVGEVLDQAHVTDINEAHTLIESDAGRRLVLWDTPGFGDTARLLRRLRGKKNPLGWFLSQVWDRFADRAMWCSQQAVLNVQRDADVVLYLLNAAEDPEDAGYVATELEILDWIGRPVICVLNQTGPPRPAAEEGRDAERWRSALAACNVVGDVVQLDAFTRCWVQEGLLFERVRALLPEARRELLQRLVGLWRERQLEVFQRATCSIGEHLAEVVADRESLPEGEASKSAKRRAMDALAARLDLTTRRTMEELLSIHGLEGAALGEFRTALEDFHLPEEPAGVVRAGVLGGVVGGALSGLAADLAAGGMTLGGGMLAGGILGALGSAGLARGYQLLKGERTSEVSWSPEFAIRLLREDLLRYLAVAHYGRGRGDWREAERPQFWTERVERALLDKGPKLKQAWTSEAREAAFSALTATLLQEVLLDFYPEVEPFLLKG